MTDFLLRTRSTEGSGGLFCKAWRHSRDFLTICGNFVFARVLMHLTGNGRSAYLPPSGRFIWGNCLCHQRSVVLLFFFFLSWSGKASACLRRHVQRHVGALHGRCRECIFRSCCNGAHGVWQTHPFWKNLLSSRK